MNSIHLDYPINHIEEIRAGDIPEALSKVHPKQPGYRIQGTEAILIPEAWLTYLFSTNHEDRSYDRLHQVIAKGEYPESAFQFVINHLGTLGFRQIRRIADSVRFLLDISKIIQDRTVWDPFLEKLDVAAARQEQLYREVTHIEWAVPGPDYTLMLFCRDQKLRFLDVSPLMDQVPFYRIKDPDAFRSVTVHYGTVTWFPGEEDKTIDISPDWCYDNGIIVDLFSVAMAIREENPIHSMELSHLESPRLFAKKCSLLPGPDSMDPEFLELLLPDPADEAYPMTPKSYYCNMEDMRSYMESTANCFWSALHQDRLQAYRQYCDGDSNVKVHWLNQSMPLFVKRKVAFQLQHCLENVHWFHVDHGNRVISLRAKKIILEQVILEINEEYVYCVRPAFEGLEQADYQLSRWMPVTKELFSISNAVENRDGRFVSLLYMKSGRYSTLCLALAAMENPALIDLRAVMDEFFGEHA